MRKRPRASATMREERFKATYDMLAQSQADRSSEGGLEEELHAAVHQRPARDALNRKAGFEAFCRSCNKRRRPDEHPLHRRLAASEPVAPDRAVFGRRLRRRPFPCSACTADTAAGKVRLPDQLVRAGRARRLLPGAGQRPVQEGRAGRQHQDGWPAGQRHAVAGGRAGRLLHGLRRADHEGARARHQRRHRGRGLPERPAGDDRPPRERSRRWPT